MEAMTTEQIDHLQKRVKELEAQAEIDNKGNQEWIDDLCKQLCQMEDALGFKNDQHDKQGQWVPTIGPWLERVRDLIAAEGELGDLRQRVKELEALRVPADPVDDSFQVIPGHAPVQPEDPRAVAVIKRLEAERQQLRAENESLKSRNPEVVLREANKQLEQLRKELRSTTELLVASGAKTILQDEELQQLRAENDHRCEQCGAKIIDNCLVCGAPQCCPSCCRVATLEAERDQLRAERDELRRLAQQINLGNTHEMGLGVIALRDFLKAKESDATPGSPAL